MPAAWPQEEENLLINGWGNVSIPRLVKNLNKTPIAIMIKARKLGLGAFLNNGEYITVNQLFVAIGRNTGADYTLKQWIKKGFPIKKKKVLNNSFRIIYIDDFWKWAKKYRMRIDFSKFEKNALGKEPSWVEDQRKADIEFSIYKRTPWTPEEDSELESLLKLFKYTYKQLSLDILRTETAIKRRIYDLCLDVWPIKGMYSTWDTKQIQIVIDMYNKGYRPDVIKKYIDKSALAIGGKIEGLIKKGVLIKHK